LEKTKIGFEIDYISTDIGTDITLSLTKEVYQKGIGDEL